MFRRAFIRRMASAIVGVGLLGSELLAREPDVPSVEEYSFVRAMQEKVDDMIADLERVAESAMRGGGGRPHVLIGQRVVEIHRDRSEIVVDGTLSGLAPDDYTVICSEDA